MASTKAKDAEVRFEPDVEISDQVKKLIEKKKRNVEKRKNKLEDYKKRFEKGENLLPEQAEALSNYGGVCESLQTLHSLLDQIQQLYAQQARWLKKERKASLKKGTKHPKEQALSEVQEIPMEEVPKVVSEEVPVVASPTISPVPSVDHSAFVQEAMSKQGKIFRLLQCFGEEDVRQKFLTATEENRANLANLSGLGLVPVQQIDLDWLDEAFGLLHPISEINNANAVDVFGCAVPLTSREVTEILAPSCEKWSALLLRKDTPMLEDGTTYALVAELMDRLLSCQFFADWKPTPVADSSPSQAKNEAVDLPASANVPANASEAFTAPISPPGFSVLSGNTISHQPPVPHPSNISTHVSSNRYPSGGVDRMLQTLDTSYHFMQHPATPTQENGSALHESSQIPTNRNPYQPAPPQPVSLPSYWGGADVSSNRSLQSENVLMGPKSGISAHPVDTDWNTVESFNNETSSDRYISSNEAVLTQQSQHHPLASGEVRERIASGVSSSTGAPASSFSQVRVPSPELPNNSLPPANLSWADKVRYNTSGSAGSGPLSFPKPSGIESQVFTTSGITQTQQTAGDVFTTASQSQFLSPENSGENEGGYRRRGGGGRGRGYYGGDRGRGREGGFRGSSRGGMRGGYQNGQRGRGAYA